ncbi:unnamed protein product, partial [Ectocarpus sp. 12 AP-2014]
KRRTHHGKAGSTCEGRRCACPHGRYDPSTPKKQPKLGTEVTPAGRRSTRKT